MKTLLQHHRITSAVRGMASLMLLVLSVICLGQSAEATTTYHYNGSSTVVWTTNSNKVFTVVRTGTAALTVHGTVYGSTKFTLYNSSVYWADSSHDTSGKVDSIRQFTVGFSSSLHDTSYGTLYIYDSNRWDTITLIGIGTGSSDTTTFDYSLQWDWGGSYYFDVPDSVNASNTIINHHSSSITVRAAISGDSGFKIDNLRSETLSLSGKGTKNFTVHYESHHAGVVSGTLTLTADSGHRQTMTIHLYAIDSAATPHINAPHVSAPYLGLVYDSACGTVVISNPNSVPIMLKSIDYASAQNTWSKATPTTPYKLGAYDTVRFEVCWRVPNDFWSTSSLEMVVGYSDTAYTIGNNVYATAYATAPSCFEALPDSAMHMSDVIAGGWVEGTENIVMRKDSSLGFVSAYVDSGTVSILSPSFPVNVHAGDTVSIHFRVTPNSKGGDYSGHVWLSDGNCDPSFSLFGSAVGPSTDTLNLLSPQSVLLAMTTDSSVSSQTFYFRNPMAGNLYVNSVALAQGTHFSITGVSPHSMPPDDTLAYRGLLAVTVRFNGDTSGFYHDSLIINTENGLLAWTFDLEAMAKLTPASGVAQTSVLSPVNLSLSPNPAAGLVSISMDQARQARIDIFDLLGNRLTSFDNIASHTWDPVGQANGIYIVRASGVDANGSQFTISKRLVLAK